MRIVFFSDAFYPNISGVSTAVSNYATGLAELGHQVLLIVPQIPEELRKNVKLHKNISLHFVPAFEAKIHQDFQLALPVFDLPKVIKEFGAEVVHTHSFLPIGLQGIFLARRLHLPLVTTQHTYVTDPETLKALNLSNSIVASVIQKTGVKMLLKQYLMSHDLVLAPSQDVLKDLQKLKITKPIEVLPSPILVDQLQAGGASGRRLRQDLGIKKALLFVGRLSGEKNIDLSLRIFAELYKKFPDLKFVLIGDGPMKATLFQLSFELGVSQAVVWLGPVEHSKLVEEGYYFLGDLFVTMSRFETQGLSTAEAMACGLPVIGAKAHATPEVVGEAGLVFTTQDPKRIALKVEELLNDPQKILQLEKHALYNASQLTVQACSQKLLSIYQGLIDSYQKKSND